MSEIKEIQVSGRVKIQHKNLYALKIYRLVNF